MAVDLNAIGKDTGEEDRKREDRILNQFQDIRNRMFSLKNEGMRVEPIKMKMLEGRPLIEEGRFVEAGLVRDACEEMLMNYIEHRAIFDKLESAEKEVERAGGEGLNVKAFDTILHEARELLEGGQDDPVLAMIKGVVEEIETERTAREWVFRQLLRIQRVVARSSNEGSAENLSLRRSEEIIEREDKNDLYGALRRSILILADLYEKERVNKAKRTIEEVEEKMEEARAAGVEFTEERLDLEELRTAVEQRHFGEIAIFSDLLRTVADLTIRSYRSTGEAGERWKRTLDQLKSNGLWDEMLLDIHSKGEDAMDEGFYGFAKQVFDYLEPNIKKMTKLAEKQGIALSKGEADKILEEIKGLLIELEKIGVGTDEFRQVIVDGSTLYSRGKFEKVLENLRPLKEQLELRLEEETENLTASYGETLEAIKNNLMILRQDGIDVTDLEKRVKEANGLLEKEDIRNAQALLGGIDSDISALMQDYDELSDLMPKCRERLESTGAADREEAKRKFNALHLLKRRGEIREAVLRAREFIGATAQTEWSEQAEWSPPSEYDGTSGSYQGYGQQWTYEEQPGQQWDQGQQAGQQRGPGQQAGQNRAQEPRSGQQWGQREHSGRGWGGSQTGGETERARTGEEIYGGDEGSQGYSASYDRGEYSADPYGSAPGSARYNCSSCGSSLRYIEIYQAWWCDNCQKYEGE